MTCMKGMRGVPRLLRRIASIKKSSQSRDRQINSFNNDVLSNMSCKRKVRLKKDQVSINGSDRWPICERDRPAR